MILLKTNFNPSKCFLPRFKRWWYLPAVICSKPLRKNHLQPFSISTHTPGDVRLKIFNWDGLGHPINLNTLGCPLCSWSYCFGVLLQIFKSLQKKPPVFNVFIKFNWVELSKSKDRFFCHLSVFSPFHNKVWQDSSFAKMHGGNIIVCCCSKTCDGL